MDCHCCSGKPFAECCEPFLKGEKWPETPEQLMRARYSAYCTVNMDFLVESSLPKQREHLDVDGMRDWAKDAEWLSLEVGYLQQGREQDDVGYVDFVATYRQDGEVEKHAEDSCFRRVDGKWYYDDGKGVPVETFVRSEAKVGRNDPCPCGSGKKYKKCCGK